MRGFLAALFVPTANSLEVFFTTIRNTTVLFEWIGYWLCFVVLAAVEALMFETFFPGALHQAPYTHATPFFTLVIAIIFSQWFTKSRYGYTDMPEHYYKLLVQTQTFCLTFFSLVRGNSFDRPPESEKTEDTTPSSQDAEIADAMVLIRDCCINHVGTGYMMFSAEQPDDVEGLHKLLQRRLNDCRSTYRNMAMTQATILEQIKRMQRAGVLYHTDVELLHRLLGQMQESINMIEVSSNIVEPGIFDKLMLSTMFIYLMVWIPFQQWALYGWILLVVAYPVEMMCLVSYMIARRWIRDPFDKDRPIVYMDYVGWRRIAYARIMDDFRETVSSVEWMSGQTCLANGECQLRVRDVTEAAGTAAWVMLSDLSDQNSEPQQSYNQDRAYSIEIRSQESQSMKNNFLMAALADPVSTNGGQSAQQHRKDDQDLIGETYHHTIHSHGRGKKNTPRTTSTYTSVASMHLNGGGARSTAAGF